mmetsp:Transcript_13619/g.42836  ORF Transcript_13619/g.42836 Transcript_13619/m.42836 type:complete len:785 (-) Transcript_13619:227-2581(-)
MSSFEDIEERDGVRFTWNVWPSSRLEATRLVVPLAATYSPLKRTEKLQRLPYAPVHCKGPCGTILNPFCQVDFNGKLWVCPFCFTRNHFPQNYTDISPQSLPGELIGDYTTIEYALSHPSAPTVPSAFLFIIDICVIQEEFEALRDAILQSLSLLPEDALVGLITIGTNIHLYELGHQGEQDDGDDDDFEMTKSYVFRGDKELDAKALGAVLSGRIGGGLRDSKAGAQQPAGQQGGAPNASANAANIRRFLKPLSECEFEFTSILEELQRDPYFVKSDRRPARGTGAALALATGLLESSLPGSPGRLLVFLGGPCTIGPGKIVNRDLKEGIRGHSHIQKEQTPHMAEATKFYDGLAKRLVRAGHAVDIFSCALDQVGLVEMRSVVERTGGSIVNCEIFDGDQFRASFRQLWRRNEDTGRLDAGYAAVVEVKTSRELKVSGMIGVGASLEKEGPNVSENPVGHGNTCAWRLCVGDPNTTQAFYFEVVNQHSNPIPQGQLGMVQFQTTYIADGGQRVLRVTTVARSWADPAAGNPPLASGFDQEAAAVVLARLAAFRADRESSFDVMRWLDRSLIRLVTKFGDYRKDDPSSFQLSPTFSLFPQFMFHLRRSSLLQTFNESPDETVFIRVTLNRSSVADQLVMIQPTLDAYSFDGPPVPVLLAAKSVLPNRILVLDTFFHVVVFFGETIAQWRQAGYHEQPEHENFRQLLAAPVEDAERIISERYPVPVYIECDQHSSPGRFLLSVIDPSNTHQTAQFGQASGEVVLTDDVNLQLFMDHLRKVVVAS